MGSKQILHKADNLEIGYNEAAGILFCNWIGFQNEAQLRKSGEIILAILKEKKCVKVLNDNTNVIGHWHHSADWASKDWFPRMIESGLKHFAWSAPPISSRSSPPNAPSPTAKALSNPSCPTMKPCDG